MGTFGSNPRFTGGSEALRIMAFALASCLPAGSQRGGRRVKGLSGPAECGVDYLRNTTGSAKGRLAAVATAWQARMHE